jgi:hypothetical protein
MNVIALTSFVHGAKDMKPGDEAEFSGVTAAELETAGLVRYCAKAAPAESGKPAARTAAVLSSKKAPEPKNKKAPEPDNKSAPELENKGAPEGGPVQDLDSGAEKPPVEGGSDEPAESKAAE